MITTEVRALDLMSQLGKETVLSYEAEDATVGTIVAALLALQVLSPAVTLGTIHADYNTLTRSIKVDGDSILRALFRLCETVGGYIYVDNNRALQWTTSLGVDEGQQLRYRKNLLGIERFIDYTKLINKLYAYGEGEGDARIKLSDADGHSEDYVEWGASQAEWGGVYVGIVVDRSITHPNTLLAWAKLQLAEIKDPPISYEIDTVALDVLDSNFSFDALQLGSTVVVIDEDLGIDVSCKVLSIERPDLLHPHHMLVELASRVRDITDTLREIYDRQQFDSHVATVIGAGQVIVKGTFTVLDWATDGETTIDGAYIETGTVLLNMLNFVPLVSVGNKDAVIATINASGEGLKIAVNRLDIVRQDCSLEGIKWTYNKATNLLSWTSGSIVYTDNVTKYKKSISSGSTTWYSGTKYIYYHKGNTSFSNTTSYSTAFGTDNIVLATYKGGYNLNILIGRTTIEGGDIYANSVEADRMSVTLLSAISANMGTLTSGLIKVPSSGYRIEINSAGSYPLRYWNGATTKFSVDTSGNVYISGNIQAGTGSSISATYLIGGTITGKTIIISGATGILKSSNYSAGIAGWQIKGNGDAEFNVVTVRGNIQAGAGSSISAGYLIGGTITGKTIIIDGVAGILKSSNYAADTSGWQIKGNGLAEFNEVKVRGSIYTSNIIAGNTLTVNGTISAGGGNVIIDSDYLTVKGAQLRLQDSAGGNTANLYSTAGGDLVMAPGGYDVVPLVEGTDLGTSDDYWDAIHYENLWQEGCPSAVFNQALNLIKKMTMRVRTMSLADAEQEGLGKRSKAQIVALGGDKHPVEVSEWDLGTFPREIVGFPTEEETRRSGLFHKDKLARYAKGELSKKPLKRKVHGSINTNELIKLLLRGVQELTQRMEELETIHS